MTKSQRMFAIIIAAAMLISGFAFGRMAETPKTTAEESKASLATSPTSSPSPELTSPATTEAASESKAFYLTDFKTGYSDGYNAGLNGQSSSVTNTTRAGYNDGFKDGYADGYQALAKQQTTNASSAPVVTTNRVARQSVVYRSSGEPVRRRGGSKLKTALTIAAPAAIGAGIGAAAGGGRGAAAGALIGGGGGALYHLIKNRNRD
ncbi:MAG: hypothetical protein MOB07_20925 [Acidobacteria bacterium]|nr:hypothetical protein [Acidobacteriota bacterium]